MAGREITDRSSPEEIARAQRELAEAQQLIRSWESERENDPRRVRPGQSATPEHVQLLQQDFQLGLISSVPRPGDPLSSTQALAVNDLLGVGYNPVQREQEMRRIASQFDYVTLGGVSTGATQERPGTLQQDVGVQNFFVPGLGTNPADVSLSAPSTSLSPDSDAAVFGAPDPLDTPVVPTGPGATDPLRQSYPVTNIGDNFSPANVPVDSAQPTGGFAPGQADIAQAPVTVGTGIPGTGDEPDDTVIEEPASTDDSGAVDGTGVEAGVPGTPGSSDTEGDAGGDTTDPDRPDGDGTGSTDGGGSDVGGSEPVITSPDVDVSSFAEPRRAGPGSSVEDNKPGIVLRPNVLHNYANWTYNIGLYMMTPQQHAATVERGSVTEAELKNLLIRSGGTGNRGILGDKRDYYIENLRFTSVMGQNSQSSRSSNNFDISFEIVEPYGVALLAELVQLALKNGIEDHFDIPYLLEIKFRGYDSAGRPIPNIPGSGPKYIPIKIVGVTFRITSAGTIYTVTAVPFAHSPLQNQHDAFINENIGIEGRTFNELMESLFGHLNRAESRMAEAQSRQPDQYNFVVHDEDLGNSAVGFEHVTDGNVISIERQPMGAPGGALTEYIQISAGSTLKSAIQAIAAATDFGARFNTVGQPESEAGNEDRPLRLLKIIPVVARLRDYNTSTNRYARDIIYRIDTQRMYGFVLPDMPGASPTRRGWEKEYNWIFTGKNQDILDFEAEYNVQYYNIRNVFTEAKGRVVGTPGSPGAPLPDDGLTRTEAGDVYSPAIVPRTSPVTTGVYNSYRGAAHQLASDHMDNVLNNPGADMVSINLSIIGDPDWIPQDRSILPALTRGSGDARYVGGSIATDVHDVFVMLKFKTPRDYDPEKGLMRIETDHTFVQGLYRTITVESTFIEGKFEQKLRLIRVQDQVSNNSENTPELTPDSAPSTRPTPRPDTSPRVEVADPTVSEPEATEPPAPIDEFIPPEVSIGEATGEFPDVAPVDPDRNIPEENEIDRLGSDPNFDFGQFGGP